MKKLITCLFALLCSSAFSIAETHVVEAYSTTFVPDSVTVAPGDVIRWEYVTGYPHSVYSGSNCTWDGYLAFNGLNSPGDFIEWTVPDDAPNEIPYFCQLHCGNGMTAMINVETPEPLGDMQIGFVTIVNADIMEYTFLGDSSLISILGDSIAGSSFNLGVEIEGYDIDVELTVYATGTGLVNLLDITAGTDEPLGSGTLTLLAGQRYMFHGNAGQKGTMGFNIIWPFEDMDEEGDMTGISLQGDATVSANGDSIMFTTTSEAFNNFVTFEGETEMMMTVIGGVTSSTLTLPANGDEGLVAIPAGTHIIELTGFAVLTLDMSEDDGGGLPEDVNGDGVVDVTDLLAIIGAWGATSP
jgi:plastocyanin